MFPGRAFLGIGSGEALNEVPVGDEWPSPKDQIARMQQALSMIDRLWKGETITEGGPYYRAKDLKLHALPERRPPIWVSAFGPQAAAVAGRWGVGLWTLPDPESTPEVIEAYREAGGAGEIVFQALFSWAETDEAAFEAARRWKGAQPEDRFTRDWHEPQQMYEHGEQEMSDEEFAQNAIVGSDPHHVERLRELEQLGAEVYGEQVLPALRGTRV